MTLLRRAGVPGWALALALVHGCTASPEERRAAHLERAEALFAEGDYAGAAVEYRNVLQIAPKDERALPRLGLCLYHQGRLGAASRVLLEARELDPTDLEVRARLATIHALSGEAEEAREEALFVLERDPASLDAAIALAQVARSPEAIEEAEGVLEALRAERGDEPRFYFALGRLLVRKGDPDAAEQALRKAAAIAPDSAVAHLALATFLASQGDAAGAEAELRTAVELSEGDPATRLQLADFFLLAGRVDEARAELAAITKDAPDFVPAWYRLARVAFAEESYDEAATALDAILERNPRDPRALDFRGRLLLAEGERERAIDVFGRSLAAWQSVVERRPGSLAARYHLAVAHARVGQIQQAKMELARVLDAAPGFVQAAMALAELHLGTNEVDEAVARLEAAVAASGGVWQAYQLLGSAYLAKGDAPRAAAALERAVRLVPNEARNRYLFGLALRGLGRRDEAERQFEAALGLDEDAVEPLVQLASLDTERAGSPRAGIERVLRRIEAVGESASLRFLLGRLRTVAGDVAGAEEALLRAVELDPRLMGAYARLAELYRTSGRREEAIAKLEEAVARNPSRPSGHMLLGMLYYEEGRLDRAKAELEKVLELDPGFVPAANNLAYLYAKSDDGLGRALDLAEKARAVAPDDPHVADTLGWILYRRGTYDRALDLLKEGASRLPTSAEAQFHLGMAYYKLDEKEGAWTALRRALELDESFEGADEARAVIAELEKLQ